MFIPIGALYIAIAMTCMAFRCYLQIIKPQTHWLRDIFATLTAMIWSPILFGIIIFLYMKAECYFGLATCFTCE